MLKLYIFKLKLQQAILIKGGLVLNHIPGKYGRFGLVARAMTEFTHLF